MYTTNNPVIRSSKFKDFFTVINNGDVCIFETDTVVGIGCKVSINDKQNPNIKRIFDIKNRDTSKPLPLLFGSVDMVKNFILEIPDYAHTLIDENWPGATTLIFKSNGKIQDPLISMPTNNGFSIATRIPDVDDLQEIITKINCPLACTSANFSGQNAVSDINKIDEDLEILCDFIYTKSLNSNNNNKASQIISCTGASPIILRK